MRTPYKEYIVYCTPITDRKLLHDLNAVHFWSSDEKGNDSQHLQGIHVRNALSRDYVITTLHNAKVSIYGYKLLKDKQRVWKVLTDEELSPHIKNYRQITAKSGKRYIALIKGEKK